MSEEKHMERETDVRKLAASKNNEADIEAAEQAALKQRVKEREHDTVH
jgi:hypothetical protein